MYAAVEIILESLVRKIMMDKNIIFDNIVHRHTFAMQIQYGKGAEFRKSLGNIWIDLTKILDNHGIKNFSIWCVEYVVFGYYETQKELVFQEDARKQIQEWEMQYGHLYTWISQPFQEMRLMYQDFGVIRTSKECIRHRVFVTKLKEGKEAEYKSRHDALIEQRGNHVNHGPDSNFSIGMQVDTFSDTTKLILQWSMKCLKKRRRPPLSGKPTCLIL